MMNYKETLLKYKNLVDGKLMELIPENSDSSVTEAMRYSIADGKRVRGILVLSCCEGLGGNMKNALFAACAIEMLHCYSLIHDDMPCMDNDDLRRGRASCHKKFGEHVALLAGDAMLTGAFEVLGMMDDAVKCAACVSILAHNAGRSGMILGQELDLASEGVSLGEQELLEIHNRKTGALINAAVAMGAVIGNADNDTLSGLGIYSENIGLVFQIVDDVLDCTVSSEALGKPAGSDAKQKKNTFVTLFGIDKSRELARQHTEQAITSIPASLNNREFLSELATSLLTRTK